MTQIPVPPPKIPDDVQMYYLDNENFIAIPVTVTLIDLPNVRYTLPNGESRVSRFSHVVPAWRVPSHFDFQVSHHAQRWYICFCDDADGILADFVIVGRTGIEACRTADQGFRAEFADAICINITHLASFKVPHTYTEAKKMATGTFGPGAFHA